MKSPDSLAVNVALARAVLPVATVISIYIDPTTPDLAPWIRLTGGLLAIDRFALATLAFHFAFAATVYVAAARYGVPLFSGRLVLALDVVVAVVVAVFTEGATSPSYAFFAFAIVAAGCSHGLRVTLAVTLVSALLYFALIAIASHSSPLHVYAMRPIYLAIGGYVIAFLGQQRAVSEARVHELESRAERTAIARALHDGSIQALAAVHLRLAGCRKLLEKGNHTRVLTELAELQAGVAREYDQARAYIRSLVDLRAGSVAMPDTLDTTFVVRAAFRADGATTEQILQILLEGVRNTVQHARARSAVLEVSENDGTARIRIEDDGIGYGGTATPPWSIASRVSELGGRMRMDAADPTGTGFTIDLFTERRA